MTELFRLRHNQRLVELDLRLNPVGTSDPGYRLFLIHLLPNLQVWPAEEQEREHEAEGVRAREERSYHPGATTFCATLSLSSCRVSLHHLAACLHVRPHVSRIVSLSAAAGRLKRDAGGAR